MVDRHCYILHPVHRIVWMGPLGLNRKSILLTLINKYPAGRRSFLPAGYSYTIDSGTARCSGQSVCINFPIADRLPETKATAVLMANCRSNVHP